MTPGGVVEDGPVSGRVALLEAPKLVQEEATALLRLPRRLGLPLAEDLLRVAPLQLRPARTQAMIQLLLPSLAEVEALGHLRAPPLHLREGLAEGVVQGGHGQRPRALRDGVAVGRADGAELGLLEDLAHELVAELFGAHELSVHLQLRHDAGRVHGASSPYFLENRCAEALQREVVLRQDFTVRQALDAAKVARVMGHDGELAEGVAEVPLHAFPRVIRHVQEALELCGGAGAAAVVLLRLREDPNEAQVLWQQRVLGKPVVAQALL
mmetsp:Transcript_1451/g.4410  ORF Transcript_1451/g.4410 Transcript_1451/m.4410 type:complete len:268 (+) Transcript_1451:1513-2316(+)